MRERPAIASMDVMNATLIQTDAGSTTTRHAISLRGVTKSYGPVRAVDDVDLDVVAGSVVALLGPNGAGKSTTVSMLLGLAAPDAGAIEVCGRTPVAAVRSGRIAAMLQSAGMMPGVSVAELLGLGTRMYPHPLPVAEAMDMAGIGALGRRRVDKLSGGQAQRVRFAMVAVANPDILVLDEPTTAMDVAGRQQFWESMRAYAASGRTVVFATHYLDEVDEFADRVVVMVAGRIVADGTAASVRALAGGSVVRFQITPGTPLPPLRGVAADVDVRGTHVTIRTTDPDTVVRAIAASSLEWRDITVAQAGLDDAYLKLTQTAGATS
jgi:ABC-2 type transport system ATP-binding protein